MSKPIGVLLADDHRLTRLGIRALLTEESDLTLLGEAPSRDEILRRCQELQPDVLLLAWDMVHCAPVEEVLACLRQHCPATRVLVLVDDCGGFRVRDLIANGVVGCILKAEAPEAIALAIRSAAWGGTWFSRLVLESLVRQPGGEPNPLRGAGLSKRESEVLHSIVAGMSNKEIGRRLDMAERTVEFHVGNILKKLGLASRVQAAMWARDRAASVPQ